MQKSTALVAYPVHVIPLNVSVKRGKCLIVNEHTLVGLLPVCCSDEQLEREESEEDENFPCTYLIFR